MPVKCMLGLFIKYVTLCSTIDVKNSDSQEKTLKCYFFRAVETHFKKPEKLGF